MVDSGDGNSVRIWNLRLKAKKIESPRNETGETVLEALLA